MKTPISRIRSQLSPALVSGFIWKGWQIIAVPVGIYLVSQYFTPELQGYYYTFGSLVALQSLFELGLFIMVLNVAAHEWASLSLDDGGRIVGNAEAQSRLVSLGRMMFKYYALAAGLFFLSVSLGGFVFFSRQPDQTVNWALPWFGLVVMASLNLLAAPFCSLLEGCGQIRQIYRMRVWQSIASAICGWVVIICGGGLWSLVTISGIHLVSLHYFLLIRYRSFFRPFFRPPTGSVLSWRLDVWPLQWRIASSGLVNYFAGSLFTPVMFHYQGPVMAGQMGMTLQLVGGIQSVAHTWLGVKIPEFGNLIARRLFRELDRAWTGAMKLSLATFGLGAAALFVAAILSNHLGFPIAMRILPPSVLAGFIVAGAMINVVQSFAAYLRAFKQEPMLIMSVSTSLLSGCGVVVLGATVGAMGAAWWYCLTMVIGVLWLYRIWTACRRTWHGQTKGALRDGLASAYWTDT